MNIPDSDAVPPSDVSRREFLRSGAVGAGATVALYGVPLATAAAQIVMIVPRTPIDAWQTVGRLRHEPLFDFSWQAGAIHGPDDIALDPAKKKQEVLGFGGAFTDAATYMFNVLTPDARAELFHELFHPSEMGLSVGRSCIGSSDYSTKPYSYDDSPTPDPQLTRFSIAHDKQWILPMLREARKVNPELFLLSSPWSPPGWMKDNNSLMGGTIRRRYLAEYAQYMTKFVEAYAAEGVVVDAVTSQNEVDTDQDGRMPQCTWPQEIEVGFVGRHLGPAFVKAGLRTKIWLIDHNYNLWGRALASLQDEAVLRFADGVAWHGYLGTPGEMTRVHDAYPDKHAYWTEGGPDITSNNYLTDWGRWASDFAGILRNWSRCIIAWNLALDEKGNPNIGPFPCGGVVTIDSKTKAVTRSGQFWAFAHYSRHVRRGARVLESTGGHAGVAHVAFENPDESRVVVLTNRGASGATQRIVVEGRAVVLQLPADSITTLAWT